jgi:tRNA modification GTPase
VRRNLVEALAYLEASIDFPEDEIPPRDVAYDIAEAKKRLEELLANAERGLIYRQGVRTAIVGKPNVGKSSLLNALLRTSRAIVTPIPGTTRDTLEETLNLSGIPLVLVDTAGIVAETNDVIERLSIERSRMALSQADLALLVVDGSQPLDYADREIATLVGDKTAILVINKSDLPQVVNVSNLLPQAPRVKISALTGEGLKELEDTIVGVIFSGKVFVSDEPLVSNPRHKDILRRALEGVLSAQQSYEKQMPADFIAIDLTTAISALGEITGETVTEDLLETIFNNFCVGK